MSEESGGLGEMNCRKTTLEVGHERAPWWPSVGSWGSVNNSRVAPLAIVLLQVREPEVLELVSGSPGSLR